MPTNVRTKKSEVTNVGTTNPKERNVRKTQPEATNDAAKEVVKLNPHKDKRHKQ